MMDDQDRRWPVKNLRGASRVWSEPVQTPVVRAKAPSRQQGWTHIDLDQPAPPLPEKWKNWLGVTQ
jgi:hypothetical protein